MSLNTRALLELIRFHSPAGTLLLLLPCYWGAYVSTDNVSYVTLFWLAIGAFAMRSAGCIVNDIADRHIDAHVKRTQNRPLARGALTLRHASIMLLLLFMIAAFSALMLGVPVLLLGMAWLPLVVAYPFMKRVTFFPQAFLGVTFGAGALFGSMAVSNTITTQAWWLYGAGFFWVLGYDTIYACQDKEDDMRIGVKSSALYFADRVVQAVSFCYLCSVICILCAVGVPLNQLSFFLLIIIILSFVTQICWLRNAHYMKAFKSNVFAGTLILALLIVR